MRRTATGLFILLAMALGPGALAQQVHQVNVSGEDYQPKELKAFPGDTLRFCNEGIYRRQPYSLERFNRYSQRKADTHEMIKKGECRNMRLQNPTKDWLTVHVRDAVNPNGGIKIEISPKP